MGGQGRLTEKEVRVRPEDKRGRTFRKKGREVQRPRGGARLTWSENSKEVSVSGVEGAAGEIRFHSKSAPEFGNQ